MSMVRSQCENDRNSPCTHPLCFWYDFLDPCQLSKPPLPHGCVAINQELSHTAKKPTYAWKNGCYNPECTPIRREWCCPNEVTAVLWLMTQIKLTSLRESRQRASVVRVLSTRLSSVEKLNNRSHCSSSLCAHSQGKSERPNWHLHVLGKGHLPSVPPLFPHLLEIIIIVIIYWRPRQTHGVITSGLFTSSNHTQVKTQMQVTTTTNITHYWRTVW